MTILITGTICEGRPWIFGLVCREPRLDELGDEAYDETEPNCPEDALIVTSSYNQNQEMSTVLPIILVMSSLCKTMLPLTPCR